VPETPFGNEAILQDDFGSEGRRTFSTHRIVLVLIIALALVNVTATVLMLASWSESHLLKSDVIGTLLANAFLEEQG
jgi:hypothetical protein